MLVYQVPLKFRYPFLAQIMWYAADKYVRLLERNNKELGLNTTPKTDQNKQDTAAAKKNDAGVTPKGKQSNKRSERSARSGVQEDNEKTSASAQEDNKEDDKTDTPGRRRSSRVARNEAIARQAQENAEKGSAVKSGNKVKEEKTDTEELSRTKGTPKKQAKGNEAKVEVNGENHDEDDNDKAVNSSETNEEDKTPWRAVYLTRFEVDGLTTLIKRLREWPQAKRNVPSEVEDPDGVLERLEV